jgi:protein-S-isoprenylcysteine O-methyltransferase Ste14
MIFMALREEFESQGNWLFRRRSYLPVLTIPLFGIALIHFTYPFGSHGWDRAWEMASLCISLLGIGLRSYTTGCTPRRTSGRNTRKGQVADSLNTSGIYSAVRHPLYLANFLVALGCVTFFHSFWLMMIFVLLFGIYYERIMYAEEAFLRSKFGEAYVQWSGRTPAFFPSLRNWVPPIYPFSWRTALKREYQTLFLLVSIFALEEMLGDRIVEGHVEFDPIWTVLFCGTLMFFIMVRILRRFTKVLHVSGR